MLKLKTNPTMTPYLFSQLGLAIPSKTHSEEELLILEMNESVEEKGYGPMSIVIAIALTLLVVDFLFQYNGPAPQPCI